MGGLISALLKGELLECVLQTFSNRNQDLGRG